MAAGASTEVHQGGAVPRPRQSRHGFMGVFLEFQHLNRVSRLARAVLRAPAPMSPMSLSAIRGVLSALFLVIAAVVLGGACFPISECNAIGSCPCADGTTQLDGCQEPPTCQAACAAHRGACPSDFYPGCDCSCRRVQANPSPGCTVLASTCEALCANQGGIADAGHFDGACPDPCGSATFSPAPPLTLPDGGTVTCYCSASCGCRTSPDGGAGCP